MHVIFSSEKNKNKLKQKINEKNNILTSDFHRKSVQFYLDIADDTDKCGLHRQVILKCIGSFQCYSLTKIIA